MTAAAPEKDTLPALTGVRALAALLVYFHHFLPLGLPAWLIDLAREGHVGVGVFFVLSGFLIAHRHYDAALRDPAWLRRYARGRFARLYPLYVVLCAATLLAAPATHPGEILVALTMTQGLFRAYLFSAIPQAWTLTVEVGFYAAAPLLFLAMRRGYAALALCALPLCGAALVLAAPPVAGFMSSWPFMVLYTVFGRAFEFFCGIWLARWHATSGRDAVTRRFPLWTAGGLAGVVACMALLALLPPSDSVVAALQMFGNRSGLLSWPGLAINNLVLPVFVALGLAGLIRERSRCAALLGSRGFVLLGKSSYAFYLIHVGVVQQLIAAQVTGNRILMLVPLMLVSIGLFLCVEEPLRRRLTR